MAQNNLEIQISAKADRAVKSLDDLVNKLNQVNSALNGINTSGLQNIANSLKGIGSVRVNTSGKGGLNEANKSMNLFNTLLAQNSKASKDATSIFARYNSVLGKFASTWGMVRASIYPFLRLGDQMKSASMSAMDYVETFNYFKVTMDKLGKESADEYADAFLDEIKKLDKKMTGFSIGQNGELFESSSKNLGLDPNMLMNYQARIGAITNSVGLLSDESMYAQKALSMLASDLSSLTNTDLETVMNNLQSGMTGMARSLYKYGLDITQASLKTVAYEHGVTQAVSSMTQAQKMELRLLAILEQSKIAWADQANTLGSVANQYRIMGQQASNLARVFGNLFLPIIQKVLPYINALLISLRQIFTLLGFKIYGGSWLTDVMDGISNGYSGGYEDVADDLDDVASSAKKAKNAVMGFDELNIINDSSSGSGSGGTGGSLGLSDDIEDLLLEYEGIWDKAFGDASNKAQELANRIVSYFKNDNLYGLGKWISDSLASELYSIDWNKIYKGAENFGTGLANFLNGLIQPSTFYAVGRTLANSLNTVIYSALAFGKAFDAVNLGKSIASYWNGIFENFDFGAFGETIGIWVGKIIVVISKAIQNIKWDELFDGIKKGINGFFKGLSESGVNIGDIAIVLGALTIKKIGQFLFSKAVLTGISQALAKQLASKIGIEIAGNATLSNAIGAGLTTSFGNALSKTKGMFNYMSLGMADYETLNSAMVSSFGTVATTLAGVTTSLAGIALSVHEFFDMWDNGWDIVSEILKDFGIALTALGAVMLGVCTGGVAILVAGLVGIGSTVAVLVHDSLPKLSDSVYNALSNPNGVSIVEICGGVSDSIASIGDSFTKVVNSSEQLDTARGQITDTASSIELIKEKMDSGVISVEEGTEQLKTAFADLNSAVDVYFSDMEETLLLAFGSNGAFHEAFTEMGIDTTATMQTVVEATDEGKLHAQELIKELSNPDISTEEFIELTNELYKVIGVEDELTKATKDYEKTINEMDIDYESLLGQNREYSSDVITSSLGDIVDSANYAKEQIKLGTDETKETLQNLIDTTTDPQRKAELQEAMNALPEAMEKMNADVDTQALATADKIQNDFVNNITQIISDAETEWDNMNWWQKLFSGANSADEYARQRAQEYKSDYIDPLSQDIESQFSALGIEGAGWASEASEGIINGLFDVDLKTHQTTMHDNYASMIKGALDGLGDTAKSYGSDTIAGFNNGIKENSETTKGFIEEWENGIVQFTHDSALRFGSPSQTMWDFGKDAVDGFNNGVADNAVNTQPVIDAWQQTIVNGFGGAWETAYTNITDTWSKCSKFFEKNVLTPLLEAFTETAEGIQEIFDTMWQGITISGATAINATIGLGESGVNSMIDAINNFIREANTTIREIAEVTGEHYGTIGTLSNISVARVEVPEYRTGGFPEDGLFMANHGELVGGFSNGKTAVANNEQIVEGIKSGVREAVTDVLAPYLSEIADNTRETADKDFSVSITDREIARASIRGQRSLGRTLRTT